MQFAQSLNENGPTGESALTAQSPTPNLRASEAKEKKIKTTEPETATLKESTGHGALKLGGASINLENINIATYVCDFGNVIITKSTKKSIADDKAKCLGSS